MARAEIIDDALLRSRPLPIPEGGSKDERGAVLIVAGSPGMPGAAILAGEAALRAGAGKLQIGTCASVAAHVGAAVLEALVIALPETSTGAIATDGASAIREHAKRARALVLGPGTQDQAATAALARTVISGLTTPVVIDAAALECAEPAAFADTAQAVLTPHAGEMASLLRLPRETIEADPQRYACETAAHLGVVVALKGEDTFIAAPDGACFLNTAGDIGLATSGSGDVLAGIIGGLLARGCTPLDAAIWGVALHARAGAVLGKRIGMGFLAREIATEVPARMRALS